MISSFVIKCQLLRRPVNFAKSLNPTKLKLSHSHTDLLQIANAFITMHHAKNGKNQRHLLTANWPFRRRCRCTACRQCESWREPSSQNSSWMTCHRQSSCAPCPLSDFVSVPGRIRLNYYIIIFVTDLSKQTWSDLIKKCWLYNAMREFWHSQWLKSPFQPSKIYQRSINLSCKFLNSIVSKMCCNGPLDLQS